MMMASLNKAAVAAAKQGEYGEALAHYNILFRKLTAQHLTHPELYVTYSNRSACYLALGQYEEARQDAEQCMKLLGAAAARAGLTSPSHHPHWTKACQRMADALVGLDLPQQAVSVYEAGLTADPFNSALKAGLQRVQQRLIQDMLHGKALNHKALPAPPIPERITLAPHNVTRAALCKGLATKPSQRLGLSPGQQYSVGWREAAVQVIQAAESGELGGEGVHWQGDCATDTWQQLPRLLLTPAAAVADPALRDVYEYVSTQCNIQAAKRYLSLQLTDAPRLAAWWSATAAAVQAVRASGRECRVLLLGARAGLLAVAAARAGAVHITCVEQCPYLAAACRQVLLSNAVPPYSFAISTTPPASLKLGKDLPMVCNCLIADVIDDGVFTGGFVPAVAHALDELLVRQEPVLVPTAVSAMAQAFGVKPSGFEVQGAPGSLARHQLDLSAIDQYRWAPSQALPSPIHPAAFLPLSAPQQVWHMPSIAVQSDRGAAAELDVEITRDGTWSGVAVWAELQLFGDIAVSTAGPWKRLNTTGAASTSSSPGCLPSASGLGGTAGCCSCNSSSTAGSTPSAHHPALCWLEGLVPVKAGEVYPLVACHNTVRLSVTLKEADYQQLFLKEPSFPHTHFGMAADQPRLSAFSSALKAAITRAAAAKRQAQQAQQSAHAPGREGCVGGAAAAGSSDAASGEDAEHASPVEVVVLDLGCGSGVLSLLAASAAATTSLPMAAEGTNSAQGGAAAAAAAAPRPATTEPSVPGHVPTAPSVPVKASVIGVELVAPLAAAAIRNAALNGCSADISIVHGDAAMLERGNQVPVEGVDVVVFDMFDAGLIGHQVLGLLEVVKAKLLAEGGQVVPACATLYAMGVELAPLDKWQLPVPASSLPPGGMMSTGQGGSSSSGGGSAARQNPVVGDVSDSTGVGAGGLLTLDLSVLEQYRWSGEPEAVHLAQLPHRCLTRPVKVFDFDFCAPAGTPYPTEAALQLEVVAGGRLNGVAVWFDLHLAEGVATTSAPCGFTTGGRSANHSSSGSNSSSAVRHSASTKQCSTVAAGTGQHSDGNGTTAIAAAVDTSTSCKAIILHPTATKNHYNPQQQEQQQQQPEEEQQCGVQPDEHASHWGQSLHCLDCTAAVAAGDEVILAVQRQGPKLSIKLVGGRTMVPATAAAGASSGSSAAGVAEIAGLNAAMADSACAATGTAVGDSASSSGGSTACCSSPTALQLEAAPRPPWLRAGAGIEDPAVWSVKKCQQLLAQMLQRAPGGKFPPIWQDLALMQAHAGSLGLDAAVVGALTQQLTMLEALAAAAGRQVPVSGLAVAEAAGTQPPLVWR